MANEIKNRQHAEGQFVGSETVEAPFTQRIISAVGIDSFVRNSAGNYTAVLRDAIGFSGAAVRASLPANFPGSCGAQLSQDGATVLVTVFDGAGAPADSPFVSLEVVNVVAGQEVGPAGELPTPPAGPHPALTLLGWCQTDSAAAIVSQTGLVESVTIGDLGRFKYILFDALEVRALSVQLVMDGITGGTTAINTSPGIVDVLTFNIAGVEASYAHWVCFYA